MGAFCVSVWLTCESVGVPFLVKNWKAWIAACGDDCDEWGMWNKTVGMKDWDLGDEKDAVQVL